MCETDISRKDVYTTDAYIRCYSYITRKDISRKLGKRRLHTLLLISRLVQKLREVDLWDTSLEYH